MTIWVNKKTGATKNQYTQPMPYSEWEKKKEAHSSSDDGFLGNPAADVFAIAAISGAFDSPSPSYDSSPSFDGGGGDFGGGGGGGDW